MFSRESALNTEEIKLLAETGCPSQVGFLSCSLTQWGCGAIGSACLSHINGIEGLRKAVVRTIINRLSENGVNTDGLSPMLLDHCLPVTTVANKTSWEMLLRDSLQLSDKALMDILTLNYSGSRTNVRNIVLQQTVIYIRSFHMTAGQLQEVAAEFCKTGHRHTKITTWLASIQKLRADQTVYIRYVGRTTRDVLRRHREDLLTRRAGFLAKFLTCLETMFPTVIDSVVLYTFPTPAGGNPEVTLCNEIREQAVIALLNIHSLLNQTLSNAAHLIFSSASHNASLAAWADDIQCYAREHQESVSRFRNTVHDFPDNLRAMLIRQATPSKLYGKFVLFLTAGAEAFYEGSSDSAKLIKDFLSRLWSWEQNESIKKVHIQEIVSAGGFPFVDLCPWQKATGKDLKAAAQFLKRYIFIAKPLILLTFSEKPSSVLGYGSSDSSEASCATKFWSRVGQVELIQLGSLYRIQIPCFHPGQGRFSPKPDIFLTIFDMTLWVLLLAISISLDSVKLYRTQDRKEWCKYIKQQAEQVLLSAGFYEKSDLYRERPRSTATALTVTERSKIAIATRRDVDQLIFSGLAVDGAISDSCRQQTYRLWELNIPDLHLHIGRERPWEGFQWANSLPEGASLFVEAIAVPLWGYLHASRVSSELSQAVILRFKAMYRAKLDGAEVFVWKNRSFPIYWITPSGQKYKFVMRAPQSILDGSLGKRKYIFFTEDGIDLRDGEGTSCLVRKESLSSDNKVTFPVNHLPNCQDTTELGSRLVELWEYETGLSWMNTALALVATPPQTLGSTSRTPTHPPSFYIGGSLPLIRSNWSESKLAPYRSPPVPADETWLLWMCLKEQWPSGGILFIGIPEKWPLRQDNIWVHFRELLSRSAYRHHPRLGQMIKNIEHFCCIVSKRKVQERDRARLEGEGKDVKIAGTELEIIQRWR
ncbi:hypothetical protein BJX63DRAFT_423456 [Aspergillus granulosus]|uniref:Uncharacterized protein n=1 Tax=Aspergillus granulosus TaxID=176169 RepID=A0ABR4H5A4_9EURO